MDIEQYFTSNTNFYRDTDTDVRYKRTTRYGKLGNVIDVSWYRCDEELDDWVHLTKSEGQVLNESLTTDERWFILTKDDSGHDYVIPADKAEAWEAWLSDEEAVYEGLPEYATRVEGGFKFRQWKD